MVTYAAVLKTVWWNPKLLELLWNPTIPLLAIYPRELKMYVDIKMCTQMLTTA
jgi:hypothetical protein